MRTQTIHCQWDYCSYRVSCGRVLYCEEQTENINVKGIWAKDRTVGWKRMKLSRKHEIIRANWLELQHPKIVDPALYREPCRYGWSCEIWSVGITMRLCIAMKGWSKARLSVYYFLRFRGFAKASERTSVETIHTTGLREDTNQSWAVAYPFIVRWHVLMVWYH